MACNWAPHNLNDIARAINQFLEGSKIDPVYPDFPTGNLIINKDDIPKIMETGHGTVKIRARYTIEKDKIIFYEVPYGETIEGLVEEVGKACENKDIEGISDIHDESSKKIRIVVTCDTGVDPELVVSRLYAKTKFQSSFSYNQVALIDKTPTELNLRDAIKIYVDHNLECIVKETQFDLDKATARKEVVDGLLKALEDIDNIITLIKKSDSAAAAKENLIAKYNFTENQAKAILAMRLSSLAKLEKVELEKEAAELKDKILMYSLILQNKDKQISILKERLQGLVKKYGDERRTELTQIAETKEERAKVEIVPEDVVVIINAGGDVKRIPKKNFKTQHRKGVGVKTLDNAILQVISTNTIDTLMIFTSTGKMYRLSVDKIPEGTNASKGINLKTILPFEDKETVQCVASTNGNKVANYVVFFTKKGMIKKTAFEEYSTMKKTTGIQAIKLKEGDEIVNVDFMETSNVILITKQGMAIRVPTDDIRAIGRLTSGVKGINLKEGDEVVYATYLYDKINDIVVVTSAGKSKRMKIKEFIVQGRGGRGISCIKLDPNDYVVAAAATEPDSSLLIIGKPNSICVSTQEISEQGKAATGTKVIERSIVQKMVRLS